MLSCIRLVRFDSVDEDDDDNDGEEPLGYGYLGVC